MRLLLGHLALAHERVDVDILAGDTLTDAYAALNPARQTPVLVVDGHALPESNAILWFLAEGTPYLSDDPLARAETVRWLLFEQTQVVPIAGLRFRTRTGLLAADSPQAERWRRQGRRALDQLEGHLTQSCFLVGSAYSIADIAVYAYVHVAPEAGLELAAHPAVERWLARVEERPGFVNDLVPLPDGVELGRGLSIYG